MRACLETVASKPDRKEEGGDGREQATDDRRGDRDVQQVSRHALRASGLALAALGLAGCASAPLSLKPPRPVPTARDYDRVRERWTREGRIISLSDQDTVLVVSATLRSPEFQEAFAARYVDLYRITDPAERQRVLSEERQRTEKGVHFLVRTAGHSYPWAELGEAKGHWRVTLLDDEGRETVPATLEAVRGRRERLEAELYGGPDSGLFSGYWPFVRCFHLSFPAARGDGRPLPPPDARKLTLRFAGPKGRTDLTWTFAK